MKKLESFNSFLAVLFVALNVQLISGFRGAVFEHAQQSHAMSSQLPEDIIRVNLEYYKMAAKVAKSKETDVIIFPEYGVFPPINNRQKLRKFLEYIPNSKVHSNPCEGPLLYSKRPILYTLSCIAQENKMIVVANMGDIQPCEGQQDCPKDGAFHYNTAVAFDRNGTILAKYHKEHLSDESAMDLPTEIQDPTFQTDVGRFAMFVCFDIVFQRITEVAHWKGVDAVLLPTMWINSAPLFTYIQYFEAWSAGNNVTLLAANIHISGSGSIGSGIMKGSEGAIAYTFNPDGNSKLIITDILKPYRSKRNTFMYVINSNGSREWTDDGKDVEDACSLKVLKPVKDLYKDYRCLERDTSNFTLIKLTMNQDYIEACNNGMCCSLHYSANTMQEDFYLGVYNGSFNVQNLYFFAEENCFVGRCDEFKHKSCATFPTRSHTLFNRVHLKANFSTNFIYPTVMSSGLRLEPRSQWKFANWRQEASISFDSITGKELLMAGFKARAYKRDPPYKHCKRRLGMVQ